jgi:NAD+ kinase
MSVGGDGTFLDAASLVINNSIPIVGVSTGRLGFLAGVTTDELDNALSCILSGNFTLDERNLIRVDGVPNGTHYALNDVCIQKRGAAIAEINAFIDRDFLSTYWADGLIVATPTGSTAYSLSAGGPIVTPNSSCFTISPIAPHNLSVRPIVIPDSSLIELEMITRSGSVIVSIDSKSYELPMSAKLKIQKAENSVNFIKLGHMNFYQTLRDKLLWGLDIRS